MSTSTPSTTAMSGKTCLVTGGNRGIGFAIAKGLAAQGATVVLVVRDEAKGEAARRAIVDATENERVEVLPCDLSLMADVRRAVDEFKRRHEKLHVLVNNAGIFLTERSVTSEGIERVLAVNYLSHFLLTNLLLDTLKASAPARIVNVATKTMGLKLDLDDLMLEKSYSFMAAMARTKLGLILMTTELAPKLEGTGVTINAMHPGVVKTELLDDVPKLLTLVFKLIARSPEQGADTAVWLASSPDVLGVNGKLFADRKEVAIGHQAKEPGLGARLWTRAAGLTGLPT